MAFFVASIELIAPPWAWQLNAHRNHDSGKKSLDNQHLASFRAKNEGFYRELHLLVQRLNALIKFDVSFPSSSRLKGQEFALWTIDCTCDIQAEQGENIFLLPLHLSTNVFMKDVMAPGLSVSLGTSCCQSYPLDIAAVLGVRI